MSFAGVSFFGDDSPSRSASPTTSVTVSGYHLLVVKGYSRIKDTPNGEYIRSSGDFELGGYRWAILCYPNGSKPVCADYISVALLIYPEPFPEPMKLQLGFSFIDQVEEQEPLRIHENETLNVSTGNNIWVSPCFMKRETFEKSRHLKNDSFTIRCDIIITKDVNIGNAGANTPLFAVPPPEIQHHLSTFLQSEEGSDVTFEVGGKMFAAHRCMLAARSRVFKAQLFGPMKEGTGSSVISVDDIDAKVFNLMLNFIYSDLVPKIEEEEDEDVLWQHLLVVADRYDLQRLKLICERKLCGYIETSNVVTIIALAEQHNCQMLKEACLKFLNFPANLRVVMDSGSLDHLISSCPSALKELIAKLASLDA